MSRRDAFRKVKQETNESLPEISEWSRIDKSHHPDRFINYLRDVSKLEFIRTNKLYSYHMLNLKKGDRVLDVGCGLGHDVMALGDLVGKEGLAVGVDRSGRMIEFAKKRIGSRENVRFEVSTIETLPFPTSEFDACRCERLFVHLQNPRRALSEIVRVAKSGGLVHVIDVDWETLVVDSGYRQLTRALLNLKCDTIPQGWMGRQLPGLFSEAGLGNNCA